MVGFPPHDHKVIKVTLAGNASTNLFPLRFPFDDFQQTPSLKSGQRPTFDDSHPVAFTAGILCIMCKKLLGAGEELFINRVRQTTLYFDGDRLVHFNGSDHA